MNQTLAINTNALMHICREFLPGMLEKGEGRIVNIASAAGMVSNPKMSVYCGSKWAVIGWSDSVRLELEMAGYRNIKVTTVTLSYIDTGMFAGVKAPLLTRFKNRRRWSRKCGLACCAVMRLSARRVLLTCCR
ncbi:SDR family NAD(P)-dependent oxidoreductase [Plesiomonas shigelloides subsp. oncorhynchi]|nr:SDR family NAD(P)-dependent oxidoreductase [Plesiomonas shigelloides]